MKQEIVLPKFKIPGQANWLVRGIWIGGGVVVLLTVVVVWALAKQTGLEEAQAARQQEDARKAAAAAAAAAVAPKPTKPVAGRPLGAKTLATSTAPAKPGMAPAKTPTKAHARAGHTARKKIRGGKLFATKAGARSRTKAARAGSRPAAVKPKPKAGGKGGDAIDDILRNFK